MSTYKSQTLRLLLALSIVTLITLLSLPAGSQTRSLTAVSEKLFKEDTNQEIWQMQRSKRIKSTEDVQSYLQTLNLGEFNDWRLPTKQELYDIFSIFDLKQNGEIKVRLEGYYWLADEKGQAYVGTWKIGDQCGPSRSFSRGTAGHIRAVRP